MSNKIPFSQLKVGDRFKYSCGWKGKWDNHEFTKIDLHTNELWDRVNAIKDGMSIYLNDNTFVEKIPDLLENMEEFGTIPAGTYTYRDLSYHFPSGKEYYLPSPITVYKKKPELTFGQLEEGDEFVVISPTSDSRREFKWKKINPIDGKNCIRYTNIETNWPVASNAELSYCPGFCVVKKV